MKTVDDNSDDLLADQLRDQVTRISVRPGSGTWPGVASRVPGERRRRAARRFGPVGLVVAVVAVVLALGTPGDGGQAAVVPARLPQTETVQPPLPVVAIPAAMRAAVVGQCDASLSEAFTTLGPAATPGEVIAAVRVDALVVAAVASEQRVTLCQAAAGPDGGPVGAFDSVSFFQDAEALSFLAPPVEPVAVYTSGSSYDGETAATLVVGRVSPAVARLVVYLDGVGSSDVALQEGGAFIGGLSGPRLVGVTRLGLRAYDSAGAEIFNRPPPSPAPVPSPAPGDPTAAAAGAGPVGPVAVPLTAAARTELAAACVASWLATPGPWQLPPDDGESPVFFAAVRNGDEVTVASVGRNTLVLCTVASDGGGRPVPASAQFAGARVGSVDEYLREPAPGVGDFGSTDDVTVYDESGAWYGRVSAEVDRLYAVVFPTGETFEVPIDTDGGFLARVTKPLGINFVESEIILYAYDVAGNMIFPDPPDSYGDVPTPTPPTPR